MICTTSIGCIYEIYDDGSNILVPTATAEKLFSYSYFNDAVYFIFPVSSVAKSVSESI